MRYDPSPMETSRVDAPDDRQLAYLKRLLDDDRAPESGGEFLYITRTEGKPGFWELLGFRVVGLPRSLLGAVHFQAQSDDPLRFARRSLGHFLSAPPQAIGLDRESYPADLIALRAPFGGESLPDLLGQLKRGETAANLFLDADHVEIAFDFRRSNPSLQRPPGEQARTRRLVFRTREGHVLLGSTLNLGAKLRRAGAFLAVTGVRQYLPGRVLDLPTLVVHRDFLAMMADAPEGDFEPTDLPGAFSPEMANPCHLLDPRLGDGAPGGER